MSGKIETDKAMPDTLAVVAGRDPRRFYGFVNTPVFRGSTVLFPNAETLRNRDAPYIYGCIGGPTHEALEEAVAAIEGGYKTRVTSSGLAAITLVLLAYASAGDHILVVDNVYGPTRRLADTIFTKFGVQTTYFDPGLGADIKNLMRENTKLVLFESPGSQTFEMVDVPAIAAAARAHGVMTIMDNTWASPAYFKPFAHGVDVSIQAATKYIVGHSDAMLGTVTTTKAHWPALDAAYLASGMCAAPDDIYLALRGLRTMNVRLAHHMKAGIEMAKWLQDRPEVDHVRHPALPTHPGHHIWKRDFLGASGLFGFVLKPCPQAAEDAFLDTLKLFGMGYSWGGFESLIISFNPRAYRTATRWNAGGPAFRIHIGLEDVKDLKADLASGFEALKAAG
ncbi:Cystathionine beta-lyase [hydrothermal vent metagenome]|uniref:Cystathionine beta-lyase n=1 Tax=hydrothermal vent metagenome TaxID=652676 RepID=A0A3B0T8S2_9ZZZZ